MEGLISARLMPNLSGHAFFIRWDKHLYMMKSNFAIYVWGYVMLGQLYHDIHMCVYHGYNILGIGVTLLHI